MAKELFLYDAIWNDTAQELIEQMQLIPDADDVTVRTNCPGGSVFAGWGVIAEMQKRAGKTTIAIDGNASSMAFMFAVFAGEVTVLDTTKCLVHRAAMWSTTEEDLKMLEEINAKLKSAIESKVDVKEFNKVSKYTLDLIFDPDARNEIWLSAQDLVQIGLVKKENVLVLTPEIAANLSSNSDIFLGNVEKPSKKPTNIVDPIKPIIDTPTQTTEENIKLNTNSNNTDIMADKAQLQEASQAGAKQETERAQAWAAWKEVDPTAVFAGIESGEEISAADTQKFMLALGKKAGVEALKNDSPVDVTTTDATATTTDAPVAPIVVAPENKVLTEDEQYEADVEALLKNEEEA